VIRPCAPWTRALTATAPNKKHYSGVVLLPIIVK